MPLKLPRVHDTVVHMLTAAAISGPAHLAVIDGARRLTYWEYMRCVGGFARELIDAGCRGERVVLLLGNSLEMAVAMFAVHAAGAQAVPVNPQYTARELRHILSDAEPHLVIHDTGVVETIAGLAEDLGLTTLEVGVDTKPLDAWRNDDVDLPRPLPSPNDWAMLQYTGGTTGLPKGANATHRQLSTNLSQFEAVLPTVRAKERLLCVMPLFHCFAISTCLHRATYAESTMVVLPRYHPAAVIDAIESYRITIVPAGPTVFNGLMGFDGFEGANFSSLRYCISGSAPLPAETLVRWEAATGCPIYEGYGQTEAGPVISFNGVGQAVKPGSTGVALPNTVIEIVDVATGTEVLATGEQGEIRVRGPQIMSGYRNHEEENAANLRDGWLYTGDIGAFDDEGYLFIRDRKKDMAIVGGYNVYPREIDEVLYGHPGVLEAAAVGVADAYRGEIIRAYVVAKPDSETDAEAILAHCRQNLAKYKVPASIEFVDTLPKTTVGKIDKRALRGAQESDDRDQIANAAVPDI